MKLLSIFKRTGRKYYTAEYELNQVKHSISLKTENEKTAWENWNRLSKKFEEKQNRYSLQETKIEDAIKLFKDSREKNIQASTKLADKYRIDAFLNFFNVNTFFQNI